jgi:hypothetical protein
MYTSPSTKGPRPTPPSPTAPNDGMMRYRDGKTGELIKIPVHNLANIATTALETWNISLIHLDQSCICDIYENIYS